MGAAHNNQSFGGRWSSTEKTEYINVLELQAAFFGLTSFCANMSDIHVKLELDNTTATAYINNMGGSKSDVLNQLAHEWCISRSIWVTAAHIPGAHNIVADKQSRKFQEEHEWRLSKSAFEQIVSQYPDLNVDLFCKSS